MNKKSLEKYLNISKKFAGLGIISGILLSPGCSVEKKIESLYNGNMNQRSKKRRIEEVYSENLSLNRNNSVSLFSEKSLNEGLRDIRKHNRKISLEEAWIYFGNSEDSVSGKWYEIGKNSTSQSVGINSDYVIRKLKENMDASEIYFVHNHSKSPYSDEKFPSYKDFNYLANMQNLIDRKIPEAKVKGLICSENLVTSYNITDKGLEKVISQDNSESFEKNAGNYKNHMNTLEDKGYLKMEFNRYENLN